MSVSPQPTLSVSHPSKEQDVEKGPGSTSIHGRPLEASKPKVDVPQLKSFKAYPGFLYFLSYASAGDLTLYAIGAILAVCCALPFSAIDLLYGHFTSGLVTPKADGSAPTPADIRAVSLQVAYISIGVMFGMWILTGGFFFCLSLASSRVVARMRRAYLAAVLSQDQTYFETIGPGEVASRLSRDIGMVQMGVGEKLGFILWSSGGLITAMTVSFATAPRIGGVLFCILPFTTMIFVLSAAVSSRASKRVSKTEGEAASFLEAVLSSVRIVKVFQASGPLIEVYDRHLSKIQSDGRFVALAKGLTYGGSYNAIFICYALAFWYGGRQVAYHGLDVGKLMTSFFSMFNAMFSIVNILPHITAFQDCLHAQGRIRIEIERESRIDHRSSAGLTSFASSSDEKSIDDGQDGLEIELRNVSFAFPSRLNQKSLDNVSLTIPKGKVVALVGASGSGKSTITALLLRQYNLPDPTSLTSNIFIQDQPINTLNISFIRSQIAIVSQDPQLLAGTILENVSIGLTGTANELRLDRMNLDEVERLVQVALEQAQAWAFVQKLPKGMHTFVSGGKTGVLSGGQKQRIAVARALVRRPRILLMDEGTSALDSETEGRLQQAIAEEQKITGMTVVLIAHRLSTVRDADKIVVMGGGKKIEEGTHDELMELQAAYYTMIQRHHGVIPGDDAPNPDEKPELHHHDPSPPIPLHHSPYDVAPAQVMTGPHRMPSATLSRTATLDRSRSGPRAAYSLGIQQAEEALASVEQASADSSTSRAGLFKRFYAYLAEQKKFLILGFSCSVVIGTSFPISGWLTGRAVHSLSGPIPNLVASETARLALYMFIIALANLLLCFFEGNLLENGAQRMIRRMRKTATEAILRQEVGYFDDEQNGPGGLTAAIGSHTAQVASATGLVAGRVVVAIVNLGGSMLVGFLLNWNVTLVGFAPLLLLVPVALLEIYYFGKYEEECEKPMGKATSQASESIDAIRTVAAFGREKYIVEEFDRMQQPDVKAHRLSLAAGSFLFGLGQALIPFLVVLLFWYGGNEYASGNISLTALFAVIEATFIGSFAIGKAFAFIGDISRAVHSFQAFNRWIERQPLVAKLVARTGAPSALEKEGSGSEIIFTQVELVYPTRPERPAIQGLDLHIRPGEKVAFCGPSGGGKSSVLGLIARFYESSRGTITVDGEDIRAAELSDHYSRLAIVSQDAVLFEGTVTFNLTLGLDRPVSEEEIREACSHARILDFVLTLPDGFESQIGMKGASLSGGQRQRLCIARALLRDAKILLLDEATSALDNESEALVQEALDRASTGRTTITIAHRLSTIRNADKIYVLDDGRIVESGTHDQLLAKKGRYVELVEAQL